MLHISETDGDDALDRLIARAASDIAAADDADGRFVLITPARLRPYAERRTLAHLRDHPTGRPGVTVEAHSFTSMARSVVGNRYDGRYAKPMVSTFTLRAFLASRMRRDQRTFRQAGDTFGSANQFAAQVAELIEAGVRPDDIDRMPDADERLHALSKLLGLVYGEFGEFTTPGSNAGVIVPWVREHGRGLHVYLYGFERLSADEMRVAAALAEHADCVLAVETGCVPDYVDAIRPATGSADPSSPASREAGHPTDGTLPPLLHPAAAPHVYRAVDECDEVRQAAAMIAGLRDRAAQAGEPFSYGDVMVTTRDLGSYRAMLADEFSYQGIPVNATAPATLADQPLALLLLALLDERLYADVPDERVLMHVFRSHLLRGGYRFRNRDMDRVADALVESDPTRVWACATGSDRLDDTVRRMRSLIDEARPAFMGADGGEARTVCDALADMVRFLTDVGVNRSWAEILDDDARAAEPDGERLHHEAHKRLFAQTRTVWNLVMREFDALVERFGDEPFADFRPTFRANLETLLAEQPAQAQSRASNAVDVVAFPTAMRPYRHVFVLGASAAQVPAVPGETGLLDESERLALADSLERQGRRVAAAGLRAGTVQAKARREVLAFDRVVRYAGSLTFLCPRSAGGAAQALSPFVADLLAGADGDVRSVAGAAGVVDAVPTIDDLPDASAAVAHLLTLCDVDRFLDSAIMLDLFTRLENSDDPGSPRVFDTSVSAVQSFYGNPFELFLSRGLRVKPLEPFEFDAALRGSFCHAVLERVVGVRIAAARLGGPAAVPAAYRDGGALKSDAALVDLFSRLDFRPEPIAGVDLPATTLVEEDPRFAILASSQRMRAVHEQLRHTLRAFLRRFDRTVEAWQKGLLYEGGSGESGRKRSKAKSPEPPLVDVPLATERQYGDIRGVRADWPALTDVIVGETAEDEDDVEVTLRVRGKVDRIDRIERDGHAGSLVIDYKSSDHALFGSRKQEGTPIYYGHELQLLTYASALDASGEDLQPLAGMMFLSFRAESDNKARLADLTSAGPSQEDADRTVGDTGLRPADPKPLDLASAGALVGRWYHPGQTAPGLPTRRLTVEELDLLRDFAWRRIADACQCILYGVMPVRPYREMTADGAEGKHDGMRFSDYPDVMALDLLDERVWYRQPPVSFEELLAAAERRRRESEDWVLPLSGVPFAEDDVTMDLEEEL
ncbi:PD-(D/E)XK nuclease family protein [Bifidobacterium samirii]|uniref:PD-(D/E)XK nuclease superfamily n=1 Tax=Bifidobacterium samirii TaxID=2306974 RepID=A0A430FPB4_9BIFI|nr:PD-(D/E)XK nuclease family protein [Bifidobacterium samirii]RSX54673.1 PD-(D/E)XK nuclease superfamily [Bifidobacterium samirii]